ncbi:MAG: nitroreductase family protein [Oscillospiraceae bacterium]|nr:nitroreductase family protein [Oscillospiraceae bacterium]
MNTLDAIHGRRSIRNFNGEPITDAETHEILKAAYAAPVGRAMYDTLSLTVITNRELLDRWERLMQTAVGNPDLHPFYGAPCVILVSSAMPNAPMSNVNFSNAAILVQNMALAATELGVGACHIWGAVGVLGGNAELTAEMNIPEGMVPCCAIALGHFDGKYELREAIDSRIKTNFIK